jgi:uncharacterized BrkB/YihY/UPF0761 family membrane protein
MHSSLKSISALGSQALSEWIEEDLSRLGAALAFYTLFAIAPLLVIVLAIAGLWFGEEAARRELFGQVSCLVGSEGGEAVQALVSAASKPKTGIFATVVAAATLTALLFNLGKRLFGLYLGKSSIASAYGAAGSLVVVLLWVYCSAQILFFGAKLTQVYSNMHGSRLQPAPGVKITPPKESSAKPSRKTERNGKAARHRMSV